MATIALYANKINQMPGLIKDVKQSVIDYKTELSTLKTKTLSINSSVCNLDDVISSIQTSTQTQEEKIASLDTFIQDSEEFISDVVRIDEDVADIVRQRKDDFYEQYYYLKPECEKNGWEKFKDGCKKVGEWCKEHWKLIVTVIIVIAAVVVIVFFPAAAPILLLAAKGAIIGAVSGGLLGGLTSLVSGGSFWEGFEDGAFSGALSGAIFGGLGGAGQMFGGSCKVMQALGGVDKVFKVISCTAKISGGLTAVMGAFDMLAFGIGMFDPTNPLVVFNQKLHSSKLYNIFQFSVSAIAAFSGGAYLRMKQGPPVCFVAGTMVLTASGLVAIEEIKVGNRVISTNVDTGEKGKKAVLRTFINESNELVHVFANGEEITTTPNHLFYVVDKGWVPAVSLSCGNVLILSDGSHIKVESARFELLKEPVKVYNFEVEDWHTYHVGNVGILVHNDCKPEAAVLGSKKHGVNWKEGAARAKATNKPQGQWSRTDIDYATKMANTLDVGKSGYFELPKGATSIVYMPDGTIVSATRFWIRNNGVTWHGYPMP